MTARFPVLLADGPSRRASAARPLLDAAGWPSQPLRGAPIGPALLLIDPEHPARELLLTQGDLSVRALVVPDDRALVPALESAALGLGLPSAELVSRIATIASELAGANDLDSLVRLVATRARELTAAEAASVLLLDPDTNELVFRAARGGDGEALNDVRVPVGRGIAGWVVQHRLPALVNDPERDERAYRPSVPNSDFVLRNLISVPLFWRGEVVGVLQAVNREGGFSERDASALAALSPHLGIAINHTRSALALRSSAAAAARRSQDLEGAIQERTRVIAKAKSEWEQTFDAISEPLAVQDGFVVRRANLAYAARSSRPITQVPGSTCYALLGRSSPCPGCPLANGGRSATGEVKFITGRTAVVTRHDLRDGGEVVRYRDVTAERDLESQLRESDRRAAVVQLAAGAAHEINNPIGFVKANLAALSGYVEDLARVGSHLEMAGELLRGGKAKEARALLERSKETLGGETVAAMAADAEDLVDESNKGLERVADIIRALKTLSSEQVNTGSARADLATSAELALRELKQSFPTVQVSWLSRQEAWTAVNPLQLRQAVTAVLKNALQAAADSGAGQVQLAVEKMGEESRLRILDDGPGIPETIRPRVFEPFFTTRGVGGGVGLGLTAAYGIATGHGGRVELHPREGQGTEAVIVLPLAVDRPATGEHAAVMPSAERQAMAAALS